MRQRIIRIMTGGGRKINFKRIDSNIMYTLLHWHMKTIYNILIVIS